MRNKGIRIMMDQIKAKWKAVSSVMGSSPAREFAVTKWDDGGLEARTCICKAVFITILYMEYL